jgi:hypothetical protein
MRTGVWIGLAAGLLAALPAAADAAQPFDPDAERVLVIACYVYDTQIPLVASELGVPADEARAEAPAAAERYARLKPFVEKVASWKGSLAWRNDLETVTAKLLAAARERAKTEGAQKAFRFFADAGRGCDVVIPHWQVPVEPKRYDDGEDD